jgi:hypothetical protein
MWTCGLPSIRGTCPSLKSFCLGHVVEGRGSPNVAIPAFAALTCGVTIGGTQLLCMSEDPNVSWCGNLKNGGMHEMLLERDAISLLHHLLDKEQRQLYCLYILASMFARPTCALQDKSFYH